MGNEYRGYRCSTPTSWFPKITIILLYFRDLKSGSHLEMLLNSCAYASFEPDRRSDFVLEGHVHMEEDWHCLSWKTNVNKPCLKQTTCKQLFISDFIVSWHQNDYLVWLMRLCFLVVLDMVEPCQGPRW